jgi:GT2 family glycosyltransferase
MSGEPVSVIVVNYRAGPMLVDCVRSVLASTVPATIYVSDNSPEDGSVSRMLAAAGHDPRIRVLSNDRNLGFAQGNAVALQQCRSEFVMCLNPDAVLAQGCLEALLQRAQREPEFACFATRLIQHGRRDLLDGAGDAYHASGLVWRRGHGASVEERRYREAGEVFSACAAAALYRRDALEAAGGFDPDYFCYLEDVDLGFRLRLAGHRCLYVSEAVVYHAGSATSGGNSDFTVYHIQRNMVWTYVKNMPGILFWLCLVPHLLLNAYSIAAYGARRRLGVIARAKRDALRGLPGALRKRRGVQSHRVAALRDIWKALDKGLGRRNR